jgi:hypothetical protein
MVVDRIRHSYACQPKANSKAIAQAGPGTFDAVLYLETPTHIQPTTPEQRRKTSKSKEIIVQNRQNVNPKV